MNKQTAIQAEWIELGFEPSYPDENGFIYFDSLPDEFDIWSLQLVANNSGLIARPKKTYWNRKQQRLDKN